jgi:hypothetical protein
LKSIGQEPGSLGSKLSNEVHLYCNVKNRCPIENNGADSIRFSADEPAQFNTELATIEIRGERLPQGVLSLSGVEAPPKR